MFVTRLSRVPWFDLFLTHVPFGLWMFYLQLGQATGPYTLRRFSEDPGYVTTLLVLLRLPDMIVGPVVSYWSDSIWTKWGRRVPFITVSAIIGAGAAIAVPFMSNQYSAIGCLLVLQTMIACGQTFQALSQELVPSSQRGRASGIRSLMFQVSLMLFFSIVIGRFDDVYRHGFIADSFNFSGEILTYFIGGAAMALPAILVGLGVVELRKEKEADQEKLVRDRVVREARLLERLKKLPLIFARNLFAREFIASYLTILVLSCNIEMMSFNFLLYTEQWGYSKQDMGGNIALGILIMIPFTFLAGVLLDRVNAAVALFWTMVMVFLANLTYIIFVTVWNGGGRPSLLEILIFGEITSVLKWISITICWTLMFKFVPKNRMGAATAGINIFAALCVIASSGFLGSWIEWYSKRYSPPPGIEWSVELLNPISKEELKLRLGDEFRLHSKELNDGVKSQSKEWLILLPSDRIKSLLKEKRDVEARASRSSSEEAQNQGREQLREIEGRLKSITSDFELDVSSRLAGLLNEPDAKGPTIKGASYNYFSGYYIVMAGGLLGAILAGWIVILEKRQFFQREKDRVEALQL